ncbi:guanine nucleotide exchange factor VAV2 isoform X2 [Centruroides vittatus]|uniref:guanine nucleotide exchange factor VAV2 isoform X2 n=1 Tax=Centruroides vittatus TaxID=120091 RepID=UPI00350EFE36
MSSEVSFRDLKSPSVNQQMLEHNVITFKLIKTVADFTQQLSSIHEQHAEELQLLVETFRKRNAELRRERPSYQSGLFTIWEVLLQEVEIDSQVHGDIARSLARHLGMMLLEKTFHRKIQSRKIFLHRESFETILNKAEELLKKCHQDYSDAYKKLLSSRNHAQLAEYYDMHNAYVQQLRAANGMLEYYHAQILPKLLEELEHVYLDLSDTLAGSMVAAAEMLASKAREQGNHYDNLCSACRNVNSKTDLVNFIKTLNLEKATAPLKTHLFMAPRAENESGQVTPDPMLMLRNELVVERIAHLSLPNRSQSLRQDVSNLESQIRQLQEAVDSLTRLQQRSLESNLYNKSNELQEDISMKRFDLQVANIHLAAVKAQLELVASKEGNHSDENQHNRDRKTSTSSTAGMKNKWLKAFRSLKTGSINMPEKNDLGDKKNGKGPTRPQSATPSPLDTGQHIFQEYTYKKITPCDYCSQILRGHVRQGLKCKMCKMNVHADCQDKVSKCQPKPRLLRRQKSTSEIETKMLATEPEEDKQDVDPIYQLLKQAGDISGRRNDKDGSSQGGVGGSINSSLTSLHQRWPRSNASSSASSSSSHLLTVSSAHHEHMSSSAGTRRIVSAPHSPRRQKLSLRMKSFSLDSPESSEHVHRRHQMGQSSSHCSSHSQSPQSPQGRRQLLSAKTVRMSSVDLPDDNEKSLSSASTSPCPSPKPHRLLPTNLYVVLYNFRSRHADELDLKAGYTITVIDTSDPDWWQGKCLGKVGYFPSNYVTKLHPGEHPLQVTHTVQVTDGENGVKLLRDQIVIQVGEEIEGMVTIRTGTSEKIFTCPLKYLQDV